MRGLSRCCSADECRGGLIRGLLDQVIRRAVRAGLRGRLGEVRLLLRGIGMGGTASILIWNIGYDPVFTAIEVATGTRVPSYVDDGAILARGPRQVVAASIVLIIAGHCAGLLAEAHGCRWPESWGGIDAAGPAAAILPVTFGRNQDGWTQWHGVAPELLLALFGGLFGPGWAAETRIGQRRCTCEVKTAELPAHVVGPWRRALRGNPCGGAAVVDRWTCLGLRIAARAVGAAPPPGRWTLGGLRAIRARSWERPLERLRLRVQTRYEVKRAPALRAAHWNTYCATLIVYQTHTALPNRGDRSAIEACVRTNMGTHRWAPWWIPAALGALYDVAGAPRCPFAVKEATAALAWRRSDGWGPGQVAEEQRCCWGAPIG